MNGRFAGCDLSGRLIRLGPGRGGLVALLAASFLFGPPIPLCAQQPPDSIAVALAPQFKKEWPYGILFGNHHQSLWTTPVTVEVVDLPSHEGGLTPCREIITPDNRLLLLATPRGDTVVFTPLRERFADDQADPRDRRLIPAHPSSALVAEELNVAAGLVSSHPRLVWLPDDSLLAGFRQVYGGSAGFVATPVPGNRSSPTPFLDSRQLFLSLDADSRNTVDTRAFLVCRFIDLFTGDWQRAIWKYWWVTPPEGGRVVYSPMPAMRRHSLLMLSSFPAAIHGMLTPGFVNFSGDLSDVSRAVTTGAALDVRILSGMDRVTWEGIARQFVAAMSDSAIDAAIARLPAPHRRAEGDTIARMLRSRRDSFESVSTRYYLTLAEYAEVTLSNAAEYVTVDRLEDGRVDVRAWQRGHPETAVYSRVFSPAETVEIRIQCLGGSDTVIVRGDASRSIVLRVNGGPGDDALEDVSTGSSAVTLFYDHEGVNEIVGGEATSVDTSPESEFVPSGRFF